MAGSSASSKLLLLSARSRFTDEQLADIDALANRVTDWDFLVETAVRKYSAPYLLKALTKANVKCLPIGVIKRLNEATNFTKLRALKIAAAQLAFHKACIEPICAEHAYIKGVAFSNQFGGDFACRYCRDIDVLVSRESFERVLITAIEKGYRILLSHDPMRYATSQNDLSFVTKFLGDVGLVSADGVLIEVHRRLDKGSILFDTAAALKKTEPVGILGNEVQTLRRDLHFTYLCYHHSRHLWSHLHWLADLDLAAKNGKLDLEQARNTADTLGLRPTLDGSLKFHHLLSQPDEWKELDPMSSLAHRFLDACLMNLQGGLELEFELRSTLFSRDLMAKSQLTSRKLITAILTDWQNKIHPVVSQYVSVPLPPFLFWLYRIQRPFLTLGERLSLTFNKLYTRRNHAPTSKKLNQVGDDGDSI